MTPYRYSKVVRNGNVLELQLLSTPERQHNIEVYGRALVSYVAAMRAFIASSTPSRIRFIRRMMSDEDPAQIRADLLTGIGKSITPELRVTIPVTDVSTLYQ